MTSSNHTNQNLLHVLQQFSQEYIRQYQLIHGHLPVIEHDNNWPSPCEQTATSNNHLSQNEVFWLPVNIESNSKVNFDNVETALELTLHPDIKTYFTTLYSESLDAVCDEGNLSLLFAWNDADFQRLQENLIGHILMKQRLKQNETVFFAVTDEEDMIVSLDNSTGAVWVERVGCMPHKKLAESLAQFINTLKPAVD